MRAIVNINIDGDHKGLEVRLEAENNGEKAILHLLTEHPAMSIQRISDFHESYKLTEVISMRPMPGLPKNK